MSMMLFSLAMRPAQSDGPPLNPSHKLLEISARYPTKQGLHELGAGAGGHSTLSASKYFFFFARAREIVRFDVVYSLFARPPVSVGQLPRRRFGHRGRFIGAPPGPN